MKYLRLFNQKKEIEFFKDNDNAVFLSDIKYLNIIVGANNSRKSRFIRSIIGLDYKVIFETTYNLNKAYLESQDIFKKFKKPSNELDEQLAYLIFPEVDNPDSNYKDLKSYISEDHGIIKPVSISMLQSSLTRINENLLGLGSKDRYKTVQLMIGQACKTLEVLDAIYEQAEQIGGKFIQKPISRTIFKDINYTIQDVQDDYIQNFDLKKGIIKGVKKYLEIINNLKVDSYDNDLIYIPVLRTSRIITGVKDDIFEQTILNQHFSSKPSRLSIETGYTLYEKIIWARNGNKQKVQDFETFEKFIGQIFFQSDKIKIISHQTPEENERNIIISLPNEKDDVPIHDLGDGVQGIINLLFPVFTATSGSWIFIDEPENHLHPGYQSIFIKIISENEFIRKKDLKFFINTHSNHILAEALLGPKHTEILVFNRRDENSSNVYSFSGNEYFTLEMLGVMNTSVLISNCSIWVEGITDRLYLKAFLFAYCENLKDDENGFIPAEGLHYTYIEYGGKNLSHYNFEGSAITIDDQKPDKIEAYFVNSHVFLLADSDFNSDRCQVYRNIKRDNFVFHETNLPEIEIYCQMMF